MEETKKERNELLYVACGSLVVIQVTLCRSLPGPGQPGFQKYFWMELLCITMKARIRKMLLLLPRCRLFSKWFHDLNPATKYCVVKVTLLYAVAFEGTL